MQKWEIQLKEYDTLLDTLKKQRKANRSNLRFNNPFVLASDIAAQFFCEKKVEMQEHTYEER